MNAEDRDYAAQTALIKAHFEPVMTEPIPARLHLRSPQWFGYARAASLLAIGIAIGLGASTLRPNPPTVVTIAPSLPIRAMQAHLVYSPEVRHPVEVGAKDEAHLVKWLSNRLGLKLQVPVLTSEGFELLGGRLLPDPDGPVAQFMYQDAAGKRLTLYVTRNRKGEPVTAFRFAREGNISSFYWIDHECGYALSGELDKPALAKLATVVYRQLED